MQSDHQSAEYLEREREVRKLRNLATGLDSAVPLPGGYRIGLDGVIGLIPVVGDGLAAMMSTFIVYRAAQLGIPATQLIRMMANILIEVVVGIIPVIGDVFDFVWKANNKNLAILENHLPSEAPARSARKRLSTAAIVVVVGLAIVVLAVLVGVAWLALSLARMI